MKYEDLIRKIFKNYESKREKKKKLEEIEQLFKHFEPVKIIRETYDVIPLKCSRLINRADMNYRNKQEKDAMYERIRYSIEKEMIDYLINNNILKFEEQVNHYENAVEIIGFMKVVK